MNHVHYTPLLISLVCFGVLSLVCFLVWCDIGCRFEEYLDVSAHLYPLNCLRAVSPEIRRFKEHLCESRSNLLDVSTPLVACRECMYGYLDPN